MGAKGFKPLLYLAENAKLDDNFSNTVFLQCVNIYGKDTHLKKTNPILFKAILIYTSSLNVQRGCIEKNVHSTGVIKVFLRKDKKTLLQTAPSR